jgi:hypothetical protein
MSSKTKISPPETTSQEWATPPDYARELGVKPDKIHGLIASGELVAVNVAANAHGKPRYRIHRAEWLRWLESRSTKPPAPKARRRRRVVTAGKSYF